MAFSRIKGAGWAFLEQLTSAQITALDIDHALAIDGTGGGTYAPSPGPIHIGGSGLDVSGPFSASSSISLDGVAQVTVSLTIDGPSSALLELTSGATLQGDAGSIGAWAGVWTFTGTTNFSGSAILNGVATFNNTAQFNGGLVQVFTGTTLQVDSGSTTALAGAVALTGIVTTSGSGRVVPRRIAGVNADHTYSIADGNIIDVPTLTATRNYTFSETGAQAGDTILITMASDATVTSVNGIVCLRGVDATQIGSSVVKTTAGNTAMEIIFNGSRWQPNHTSRY